MVENERLTFAARWGCSKKIAVDNIFARVHFKYTLSVQRESFLPQLGAGFVIRPSERKCNVTLSNLNYSTGLNTSVPQKEPSPLKNIFA